MDADRVIAAALRGERMDVTGEDDNAVDAGLVRDILLGRGADPDPRGLRLHAARIVGRLDLTYVRTTVPLALTGCMFDEAIDLDRAQLAGLDLTDSSIPAVEADSLHCEHDMLMNGIICAEGIDLTDADLNGGLYLGRAHLMGTENSPLEAPGLSVAGSAFLRSRFYAIASGPVDAVNLNAARIGGSLNLKEAHLVGTTWSALDVGSSVIGGNLNLNGVRANSTGEAPTVGVSSARVGGEMFITGARFSNTAGSSLDATALHVDGGDVLAGGLDVWGNTREAATVTLSEANISGDLFLSTARISNTGGPGLDAMDATVGGAIYLTEGVHAESASPHGTIILSGLNAARLYCSGARVLNTAGPALSAIEISVRGGLRLDEGFHAEAASELAAVSLPLATVGNLRCVGAELTNTAGPALDANNLTARGYTMLNGLNAEAKSEHGAVTLNGASLESLYCFGAQLTNAVGPALRMTTAKIGGDLDLHDTRLTGKGGPAMRMDSATVEGITSLSRGFRAEADCDGAAVDLTGAHFGEDLVFSGSSIVQSRYGEIALDLTSASVVDRLVLPTTTVPDGQLIDMDGLRYGTIPLRASLPEWLLLLSKQTPAYAAQPYQQLASVHRAAGHEADARLTLIAQQTDLRRRGDLGGPVRRLLHWLSGLLIGYGYQSWRALAGLMATVILALSLVFVAADQRATAPPVGQPRVQCTVVEKIGLAAELAIPLVKVRNPPRCGFNATTPGQWFQVMGWATQILGWSFATLFIAGFTGIVRRT